MQNESLLYLYPDESVKEKVFYMASAIVVYKIYMEGNPSGCTDQLATTLKKKFPINNLSCL